LSLGSLDRAVFFLINGKLNFALLDPVMVALSEWSPLFLLASFLPVLLKERKHALVVLGLAVCAFLIADGTAHTLKFAVERARPCTALAEVNILTSCNDSFSMPSIHAANAFAFAVPFLLVARSRVRFAMLLAAAGIAYSRPYVGVHYPSDIVVGALLGSALAWGVVLVYRWADERAKAEPHATYLTVVLLAVTLFRIYYIHHGLMELSPDEAHYWEWTRRPALSYYSKGPMIAWLISAGTGLLGDGEFGVRMPAAVLSVLTSLFLYLLGRDLMDRKTGALAAMLFQAVPLFTVYGVLMTIDAPFVFFWALSLYLLHRAVSAGGTAFWLLLGVSVGLGMLSKYTMAFFPLCGFLYLLASGERRKLLLTMKPYASLLVSGFLFLPVIIWNAQNGWVTLKHTAGHANLAAGLAFSPVRFIEFAGSQLGVVTPLLLVMGLHGLIQGRRGRGGDFLFWFSAPVLVFFLLKSIQGKVEANWAMTAYVTMLVSFSAAYLSRFRDLRRPGKVLVSAALAFSVAVTVLAHYPPALGLPPGLDPSARLRGWRALGQEVGGIIKEIEGPYFVFSDSYQVASELAFYTEGHPVTYCVNLGRRMNQYDLWPGPEGLLNYAGIFVTIGDSDAPPAVQRAFDSCEKRLFSTYEKNGAKLRDYSLFVCRGFTGRIEESTPQTY